MDHPNLGRAGRRPSVTTFSPPPEAEETGSSRAASPAPQVGVPVALGVRRTPSVRSMRSASPRALPDGSPQGQGQRKPLPLLTSFLTLAESHRHERRERIRRVGDDNRIAIGRSLVAQHSTLLSPDSSMEASRINSGTFRIGRTEIRSPLPSNHTHVLSTQGSQYDHYPGTSSGQPYSGDMRGLMDDPDCPFPFRGASPTSAHVSAFPGPPHRGGTGLGSEDGVGIVLRAQPPAPDRLAELLRDKQRVSLSWIVQKLAEGALPQPPPMFGLFGGLERFTQYEELQLLYSRYGADVEPFLNHCSETLSACLPPLTLMAWLKQVAPAPPEVFFTKPVIAWPVETIKSLATYYLTAMKIGFERLVSFLKEGGIFCTGKGIFAALAVATSSTLEEFMENTAVFIRMATCTGMIYQEQYDTLSRGGLSHCKTQSFALLVINVSIPCLQQLITHHNMSAVEGHVGTSLDDKDKAPSSKARGSSTIPAAMSFGDSEFVLPFSELQITRVISHRTAVITGHPTDLLRFEQLLESFSVTTGVKIHRRPLPLPAPENSPFYNQLLKMELLHAMQQEQLIRPLPFHIPVFSPVDGKEWSASRIITPSLMLDICQTATCVPHDLTCSLQFLRPTDVVLEFGASSEPIGSLISWTKRSIMVVTEPGDYLLPSALPSPRRSSQRSTRAATLTKCAILNEVLLTTEWSGKPAGIGAGNFTAMDCSFFELGLLLDADSMMGISSAQFGEQSLTSTPVGDNLPPVGSRPLSTTASMTGAPPRSMAMGGGSSVSQFPSAVAHQSHLASHPSTALLTSLFPQAQPQSTLSGGTDRSPSPGFNHSYGSSQSLNGAGDPLGPIAGWSGDYVPIAAPQSNAIHVYRIAPFIQYLETQHRATLAYGAVAVTRRISLKSGIEFPAHTMLMCPTVFAFFEYWDTVEFLQKRVRRLAANASHHEPVSVVQEPVHPAPSSESITTQQPSPGLAVNPVEAREPRDPMAQLVSHSRARMRARRLNEVLQGFFSPN